MTTRSYSITISKRVVIIGASTAVLAAIVTAILIGFAMGQTRSSEADLLIRAMAGDEGAAKTLEEKYSEPAPVPISPKEANFTPGNYRQANPNATDGAEVAASFVLLLLMGRTEALGLLEKPPLVPFAYRARLQQASWAISEEFIGEDGKLTGLGFVVVNNGVGVDVSNLGKLGKGTILSGEKIQIGETYYAVVTTPSEGLDIAVIFMKMNGDGEWKIYLE